MFILASEKCDVLFYLHMTKEWLIFFQSRHEKSRKQDAAVQPLATARHATRFRDNYPY